MDSTDEKLRNLTARRWRISLALTAAMTLVYFGFVAMVGYRKEWMAARIVPGLSWGVLLGALVIFAAWLLTFIYVRWANSYYDVHIGKIKRGEE